MKNLDTQRQINNAIIVYDTVLPQPGARVTPDVVNTGQSLSYPVNVRRRESSRYQSFRQPSFYAEGTYKLGIVHHGDYQASTHNFLNRDETIDVIEESDAWWLYQILTNTGEYSGYRTFCRSLSYSNGHFSTHSLANQPTLDGRNLNTFSSREQVKGGLAPSATRADNSISVFNNFESVVSFDSGLTFNMSDTRGLRTGQKIILQNNVGATEETYIDSFITDTSFTISKALSVIAEADVVKVYFWGFHNLKVATGDANDHYASAYVFEPLPLESSILHIRVQSEKREEILFVNRTTPAVTAITSVRVTARIPFPIHSDGEEGTIQTMTMYYGTGDASPSSIAFNSPSTEHINLFLRAIISAAGVALAAGTAQIVSRKLIALINDLKVRG